MMIPIYLSVLCFFILLTAASANIHFSSVALTSVQKSFRTSSKVETGWSGAKVVGADITVQNEFLTRIIELAINKFRIEASMITRSPVSIEVIVPINNVLFYRNLTLQPTATEFFAEALNTMRFYKLQNTLHIEVMMHSNQFQYKEALDRGGYLLAEIKSLGINQNNLSLGVTTIEDENMVLRFSLK